MRPSTVLATAAIVAAPLAAATPIPAAPEGSEAFSLGTAWDVAKDGYNAYEAVKGAYDSFKNGKREFERDFLNLTPVQPNTLWYHNKVYREYHEPEPAQPAGAHPYAHERVHGGADERVHDHDHERVHGYGRKGHFRHTKGHGRKHRTSYKAHHAHEHERRPAGYRVHPDHEAERRPAEHEAQPQHETEHRPEQHNALPEPTAAHPTVEHQARGKVDDIDKGINIVSDAANAVTNIHDAYESWKQSHKRGTASKIEDGINIVNDAANAAQAVHGAYESWKQSHRRGVASDIEDGIHIVNDAANAAEAVHGAYESWKQSHRREPEPYVLPSSRWRHLAIARALLDELD
ncbi:predicted protein [Postia placenta Mad-698-R]|nr:predicted protein [Postia placenta Mad-698-R]